jgi:hypothetical protein
MLRAKREFGKWCLAVYALSAALSIQVNAQTPETRAARSRDALTKPIRVSADGRFLVEPNGKPFFFLAENSEYLIWRLTRDETDEYLSDRARKGFTVVMAHLVPRSGIDIPNAYGEAAFVNSDVSQPNNKYFEHVDWVVTRAAHYGLRIGLQPINGIEYVAQGKFNESNVAPYGRWLAERYRDKGIIWILGHDTTPVWIGQGSFDRPNEIVLKDFRPVYDRMAEALTVSSGHDPFITYHPTGVSLPGTAEPRTSLYWGNRYWLDMNMLQSSHFEDPARFIERWGFVSSWKATYGYEPIHEEYNSLPTRPVVDGEAHWEGVPRDVLIDERPGLWDEVDIRNATYQSVFAGAAGHSYGHVSLYAFVDSAKPNAGDGFFRYAQMNWKEALNAPGAKQIGHVKSLMLSRPYFTRIPDQSVIVGNTGEGSEHISATRDRAGSYMMIYLPIGQTVMVDMNKLSGSSAIGWWYDPRKGSATKIEGSLPTNRSQRFSPPSNGRGEDWVLVLDDESKGFAAPGTAHGAT